MDNAGRAIASTYCPLAAATPRSTSRTYPL